MTVKSIINRDTYIGNNTTDTYSYTFRIFSETHLRVTTEDSVGVVTPLTLGVDYLVTGVKALSGGTIVLAAGNLPTGITLMIRRVLPILQNADIRNQGDFYPESHEDQFDYETMVLQQQQADLDASLKVSESDPAPARLPLAAVRAGKFLAFDVVTGDPVAATPSALPVIVSPFIETLLDDTSAQVARDTLGFSGAGGTVPTSLIEADAVTTAKILDKNVTLAKLADMVATSIIARSANSTGVPAALQADANFKQLHRYSDALEFDYPKFNIVTTVRSSNYNVPRGQYMTYASALLTLTEIALPSNSDAAGQIYRVKRTNTSFPDPVVITTSAAVEITRLHTAGEEAWFYNDGTGYTEVFRAIPSASADLGAWVGAITAVTTAPTFGTLARNKVFSQRLRNRIILEYQMHMTTNGTNGSGNYIIPLPSGLSFNTTKYPVYNGVLDATMAGFAAGIPGSSGRILHATGPTSGPMGYAVPYSSTSFRICTVITGGLGWGSGSFPFGATMAMAFNVDFEVNGWNG